MFAKRESIIKLLRYWIKPTWLLIVLVVTLWIGWLMFDWTILCGAADCHCEDMECQSVFPLLCLLPMLFVRCFAWRRTLGVICMIIAILSVAIQCEYLSDCILLLTGDKHGYLHSHGVVCKHLLRYNIYWSVGMLLSVIVFWKSRRIGRSLKAPWRWLMVRLRRRGEKVCH